MPDKIKKKIKVLIVKPSSLGDILHAFPAVDLLSENLPDVEIDWLVHPAFAPILDYRKEVKNKIIFERKKLGNLKTFFPEFIKLLKELRKNRYDLVIDMQGLFRSAIIAWLAKSPGVVGFASTRERLCSLFYRDKFQTPPELAHAVEKNISLIAAKLNATDKIAFSPLPELKKYAEPAQKILAAANISKQDICIGLVPGARWKSKQWPPEFFAKAINILSAKRPDLHFLIFGTDADAHAAEKISSMSENQEHVHSFAGKTGLGELVELMRKCEAVLATDSGPTHIAAALGKPVFALFGPTFPEKTAPYGKKHEIFQPEISCIKCFKRYCRDESYRCHSSIDAEIVAERILTRLKGKNEY